MLKTTTQGAVTVMTLDTALDTDTGDVLRSRVAELPKGGRPQVVIDLSAVPLVNGGGCEALLDVAESLSDRGGAANLAGLSPLCADILLATGVGERFLSFQTTKEAVAQFAR
ncbi:MAG: STAS domain-containing protein [Lacipirellulaceae bacterium]